MHVIGRGGSELVHIGQTAMALDATVGLLVGSVFNCPTFGKSYTVAARDAANRIDVGLAGGRRHLIRARGSVLIPLLEEDGLRMGEIARRARLSKQTITSMVRLCERDGLVERRSDLDDGRATRVHLTAKARRFQPAGERVLARLEREATGALGEWCLAELRRSLKRLA